MKRILITNDDGIRAAGILRLAKAARAFGEVTVVAPEEEQSGQSHSITIRHPVDFFPFDFPVPGVSAWACSGTPSDCVRIAAALLMPAPPDLVLSGINFGVNVSSEIQYSATVCAALEAAHLGIPAIAVSEEAAEDHSVTDRFLPQVLSSLVHENPGVEAIFNVNFPSGACRGILTGRTVSAASMYRSRYLREPLPGGGLRVSSEGVRDETGEDGSDFRAVLDRYISVGIVRNVG